MATTNYAHAEGYHTLAEVQSGHAEGTGAIASGTLSTHAEGSNTMATGRFTHAEGRGVTYNVYLIGDAGATTYTLKRTVDIYP